MATSREYCYAFFCIENRAASVLSNKDHEYQKILKDENLIFYLSYLSDIFGLMNHFNRYLQGPGSNVIDFVSK